MEEKVNTYGFFFFNAMNKSWYITGDKGCVQVSSKLYVWFQKRKQTHIWGGVGNHLKHVEMQKKKIQIFFSKWPP